LVQVLAGAALAASGELAEAGKQAVEEGIHQRGRKRSKKQKKPWLNRKVEALFKPYSSESAWQSRASLQQMWLLCTPRVLQAPTVEPGPRTRCAAEQTHAAGWMIYRGFNRMGKRMQRATGTLGKQLDGAVRVCRGWGKGLGLD
jgi:hypothetical protein